MNNLFNYILYYLGIFGREETVIHLPLSYAVEIANMLFPDGKNKSPVYVFKYIFSLYPKSVEKIIFENELFTLSAGRKDIENLKGYDSSANTK